MKLTAKNIAKTKEAWQVYYSQELSDDDALEITANIVGFFTLLQEWEQESENPDKRRSSNGNDDL